MDLESPETKFITEITTYVYIFIFSQELFTEKVFNLDNMSKNFQKVFESMNKSILKDPVFKCIFLIILEIFKLLKMRGLLLSNLEPTKGGLKLINLVSFPVSYQVFLAKKHTLFKTLPYVTPPADSSYTEYNGEKDHGLSKGVSKTFLTPKFMLVLKNLESFPFFIDTQLVDFLPTLYNECPGFTRKYYIHTNVDEIFSAKIKKVVLMKDLKSIKEDLKAEYKGSMVKTVLRIINNPEILAQMLNILFDIFWYQTVKVVTPNTDDILDGVKLFYVLAVVRCLNLEINLNLSFELQIKDLKKGL